MEVSNGIMHRSHVVQKKVKFLPYSSIHQTVALLLLLQIANIDAWNLPSKSVTRSISLIGLEKSQPHSSCLYVSSKPRGKRWNDSRTNKRKSWDIDDEREDDYSDNSVLNDDVFTSITASLMKPEWNHRKNDPIPCPHFETCPGCTVDKQVTSVPAVQSAKLFFSSTSIQRHTLSYNHPYQNNDDDFFQVIVPSPVTEWRTQAKLAVAPKSKWGRDGCIFGLYERKSHNVLPIPDCQVHHPKINYAVKLLTQATSNVQTSAYDETTGMGSLRYVQLQVERMTGKLCLTLVWNAELLKYCQPELSRLVKELKRLDPKCWHSIWCHCNDGLGNAIFARGDGKWHQLDGPEFVREALPPTTDFDDNDDNDDNAVPRKDGLLYFNPMSFRQGNIDGFDVIAKHVAQVVPPNSAVCELYAGVGVLGLTALSHAHNSGFKDYNALRWLRCSDENPANPRCFERAVNTMPSEVTGRPNRFDKKKNQSIQKNNSKRSHQKFDKNNSNNNKGGKVSYMVASATKALLAGQALGAEVLIVDPPRKGLDEEVVNQLCKPFNPNQPPIEDKRLLFGPAHTINYVNEVTTLIYVSCGFDALARDTDAILTSNAGWKLASATGYLLFPGSNHLETVAVFKREGREMDQGMGYD